MSTTRVLCLATTIGVLLGGTVVCASPFAPEFDGVGAAGNSPAR